MSSWMELFLNLIGYGGFVLVASRHRAGCDDDEFDGPRNRAA
jgi:hypothetical protein